jgi:UV DNA damage endonuclease
MQRKTWEKRGLEYAGELAERNFRDLLRILEWNHAHGIGFYRCTSNSFVPWHSQYDIDRLPNYDSVEETALECGEFVERNDMRLSYHPDYFVKPASTTDDTRAKARRSLENHGTWLDLMGLPRTRRYPINVHIGGHYGDKEETAARFASFFSTLSQSVADRLVLENDDSETLWSVTDIREMIHDGTGVPITFDYHHHSFSGDGLSYREAFDVARDTWACKPIAHYSEPAVLHGEEADRPQTHASSVSSVPDWLARQADVMLECDDKEQAVLQNGDAKPASVE